MPFGDPDEVSSDYCSTARLRCPRYSRSLCVDSRAPTLMLETAQGCINVLVLPPAR
jgi:hypothetical protein